ncbi:3'-phosphoadenosine 5'-phosphate phosphatase [Sphingomonas sp. EC-HK361]|uniref:3'(2'),5'-bisphosphate nucleotidase CysQ n=1 Tax=Sphingomonas sp. EC-HK361 TaxID=2038397 RepID=UPI001254898A|nr:3'(2'),5'-bisphosphate nucleotidase CysQ [Sphingomonas sp. EC-HK361]VVT22569.1 3'-phosphoadenosine 5'-phosphate phosphatase [Sphingomonas sp. EC-HK361]
MTDADIARLLAHEAGELLLDLQRTSGLAGKELGVVGDRQASDLLMARLAALRPDDGVLCEETQDSADRLTQSRVWIVDPLDGTREYGEGRADWAVHVALAIDGRPAIGAVALPALGLVHCGGEALAAVPVDAPLRMLVSRTRPSPDAVAVAQRLGAAMVPMGSAGAKAMAVLRGEADIYLHSGGQYEWDNCAPAAVALAGGLHASRIDGAPLVYNNADPTLPDVLICRPDLGPQVIEALRAQTQAFVTI